MKIEIDGVDFQALEAEKYWSFGASFKGDPRAEARNMIFSGNYVGARKMDGAYFRFIKGMNGEMVLQGRSKGVGGDYLDKLDHVPQLMPFFEALPNGTCLLGEIYFPENEGSNKVTTIMGCLTQKAIERQEKGPKLHYYVFDIWAFSGKSYMQTKIEDRIKTLDFMDLTWKNTPYVEFARYYDGEPLWNNLEKILLTGGEGVVITKKGTVPSPGKRTARKTLKIKKEISQTIDCFFTGRATAPTEDYSGKEIETWKYWQDMATGKMIEGEYYDKYMLGEPLRPVTKPFFHGWAGSLEIGVLKDGEVVPIGFLSGLSDEIKANFKDYTMRPIEITCMEVYENSDGTIGGLRHAKMLQFRDDLTAEDCTWKKIFG